MVTTFTYKPSLVKINALNFELSWQQTHKHTHKSTDRTDYNTLRRSAQCKERKYIDCSGTQDLLRQEKVARLHIQAFGLPVTWCKLQVVVG